MGKGKGKVRRVVRVVRRFRLTRGREIRVERRIGDVSRRHPSGGRK